MIKNMVFEIRIFKIAKGPWVSAWLFFYSTFYLEKGIFYVILYLGSSEMYEENRWFQEKRRPYLGNTEKNQAYWFTCSKDLLKKQFFSPMVKIKLVSFWINICVQWLYE